MLTSSFGYFDRVYCIHLPNPDRHKAIQEQFDKVGISGVTYVHSQRPMHGFTVSNMKRAPQGEFGANLSHMKAVVTAISDGAERPIFFEDDIVFRDGACDLLAKSLADLPPEWDVLYMGGHPCAPVKFVGTSIVKVGRFSFAESYAIRRPALIGFFNRWCDRLGQLQAQYDRILGEYAAELNGYCTYPILTVQPPGFSQIINRSEDKSRMIEKGWKAHIVGAH